MSERVVLLNPLAHHGRALDRYQAIEADLQARYPHRLIVTTDEAHAREAAIEAARDGATLVAAAGGDGMVHLVLNALMDAQGDRPRFPVALGAIGLGSSNDFHKPRQPARDLSGIPVALDSERTILSDVGRADWTDAAGETGQRYFLLNASLGATAKGNWRYNHPMGMLAWLKGLNVEWAIQWATLEAIAGFAPVRARLSIDGADQGAFEMANLGIIKRPYFAGNMRYDTPVTPDDGHFDVNLLVDMTRLEFVRSVMAIEKGRFLNRPKTRHWRAQRVGLTPSSPTALEMDGEVVEIMDAALRVIPRALRVCY